MACHQIKEVDTKSKTILDIYDFIKENKYDLTTGTLFEHIWYPLFQKRCVLITKEIIMFLHKGPKGKSLSTADFEKLSQSYVSFLTTNKIEYEEIKHNDPQAKECKYIQNEIEMLRHNNEVDKTWLSLTVDNFKKSVMLFNTKRCMIVRLYFATVEKILSDFREYIAGIEKEQLALEFENKLKLKDEELKDVKSKYENLRKITYKKSKLEFNDIIYIVTTDKLQKDHFFKVGGTTKKLIKPRLSTYNTGEHPDVKFYYTYIRECINYKVIEEKFKSAFKSFRIEEDKELYNMKFDDIKNYIDNFVTDENNSMLNKYELNNDDNRNRLYDNILTPAQVIYPLGSITLGDDNSIIAKVVLDNLCKEEKEQVIKDCYLTYPKKEELKRKEFEEYVYDRGYTIEKKKNMFQFIKETLGENINYKY